MQSPMMQSPMQPPQSQVPPPYPLPPPGYVPPHVSPYGSSPPPVRRPVPRWRQALILFLTPCVALVAGLPILGLGMWFIYGDSPTPPLYADRVAGWFVAVYISIGILCGLGIHAIVIRKPWLFLAGLAITVGVIGGMIWTFINFIDNLQVNPWANG